MVINNFFLFSVSFAAARDQGLVMGLDLLQLFSISLFINLHAARTREREKKRSNVVEKKRNHVEFGSGAGGRRR